MIKVSWLQSNNTYKKVEGDFSTVETVPVGIYNIGLSMSGWYLEKYADKFTFDYKIYGLQTEFCEHVLKTYKNTTGNFGIMLTGTKGTGKTVTAKILANYFNLPVIIVKDMEDSNQAMIEFLSGFNFDCVLFFDEFETLGKERGDAHETGEIKRVVSSLLMQIDALPSYVVAIAATNHDTLLDKAAWRRFQVKIEIPKPTRNNLEMYFEHFQEEREFDFGILPSTLAKKTLGLSYAEAEELALEIYRQYVLNIPQDNPREITNQVLKLWQTQKMINKEQKEENVWQKDQ